MRYKELCFCIDEIERMTQYIMRHRRAAAKFAQMTEEHLINLDAATKELIQRFWRLEQKNAVTQHNLEIVSALYHDIRSFHDSFVKTLSIN